MANLQIKGIDDELYDELKRVATAENRSLSQEVLALVKQHLVRRRRLLRMSTPAETLLELSGSWVDDRPPEQIVEELKGFRRNSRLRTEEI